LEINKKCSADEKLIEIKGGVGCGGSAMKVESSKLME
jgi:hypothetical protein